MDSTDPLSLCVEKAQFVTVLSISIETEANNVANSVSNRPGVGLARRRAVVDNDGSVEPV